MKKYKFKISGLDYEVEVEEIEDKTAHITVNGTAFDVEIETALPKKVQSVSKTPILARKPVSSAVEGQVQKVATPSGANLFKVSAPLPGSITKINISVGDTVKAGDCLLIMEAMKMENNVAAEKGGVVQAIKVNVGDTVLQGDTLIEIA